MIKIAVALCLIGVAFAAPFLNKELDEHWDIFKSTYNKVYETKKEETLRRMIWEDHVAFIAKHNREYDLGLHTYTVGLNKFADLSNDEFVKIYNGYWSEASNITGTTYVPPINVKIPDEVDWRQEGYVTPVKYQGSCGSCWAFATTGVLEGQNFKYTRKLVGLSEQNLVDCSKRNNGCRGGWMDDAFRDIMDMGGIATEKSYPYTGLDGRCRHKPNSGVTVRGYRYVESGDEKALKSAVATVGPISVAIDASRRSFQFYRSGVYNDRTCSFRVDHAVLVVGYGTDSDMNDYWIVKNSWGTWWGDEGYVLMSRNRNNQCAIASYGMYALV